MAMNNWREHEEHDPFFEVRNLHSQVNDLFDGFFTNRRQVGGRRRSQGDVQRRQRGVGGSSNTWLPVVDVKESEKEITIHAELPGLKQEDIHIDIHAGILTLSGERKDTKHEENEHYHRVERSYGKFTRSFALPPGVDVSCMKASLADGVLQLIVPKPKPTPAKSPTESTKIQIK